MVFTWEVIRSYFIGDGSGTEVESKIRQIFPALCGCLIPVSFGMMLGWPSLAYPYLLQWDVSPIPITLDQTSLIAGFLMEGNSIGTLFSTTKFVNSKLGVVIACCLQFFGWCVMVGANDIFGLLVARSSVGFGNGYGTGQLKRYIKETCEPELAKKIIHFMPLGVNVGVILIYAFGAYVSFRVMAAISIAIPTLAVLSFGLIPKKDYYVINKKAEITKNVLQNVVTLDLSKVRENLNENIENEAPVKQVNAWECVKNRRNRNGLLLILLIVFVQQYTGGPANIVYSQIIFTATSNPYPKICSIIYAIFFFFMTLISLIFVPKFPRKANLMISCGMSTIIIGIMALYFHLKHELLQMSHHFTWAPLFILFLFNAFHTFGLGTLPFYIINEKIPKRGKNVATKFQVIHFSMSAVISTKIFQVLFDRFNMAVAYAFFVAVAIFGLVVTLLFMDEYDAVEEARKDEEEEIERRGEKGEVSVEKIEISRL